MKINIYRRTNSAKALRIDLFYNAYNAVWLSLIFINLNLGHQLLSIPASSYTIFQAIGEHLKALFVSDSPKEVEVYIGIDS